MTELPWPDDLPPDAPPAHRFLASVAPWLWRESGGLARRLGRDRADVFQDLAGCVLRSGGNYDADRGAPTTFAGVVVRHEFWRWMRDLGIRSARPHELAASGGPASAPGDDRRADLDHPPSREADPGDVAGREEMAGLVARAMADLPPDQRAAIETVFGFADGPRPPRDVLRQAMAALREILNPCEE